jgi:hypothetical protein
LRAGDSFSKDLDLNLLFVFLVRAHGDFIMDARNIVVRGKWLRRRLAKNERSVSGLLLSLSLAPRTRCLQSKKQEAANEKGGAATNPFFKVSVILTFTLGVSRPDFWWSGMI